MASHEVTIRENTGATKDAAPYLGNYASKETVRLEAGSGQMSAKCGLPPIQVLAILSGCFEAIEALERESLVRVHTDIGVICGVITGSFPTADAPFDRERNSLQLALRPDDSIRLSLVNAVPAIVNDGNGTKVRLGNIMDLETHRPMNVIHGQKPFRVAGFNMVLDDEGAGVYLQNNIGVTFPVTVDEVTSRQLFTAHVAVAVEAGDYKLYVKSRGGDPEGVLQTTFRKVKCLAAETPAPKSSIVRVVCEGHESDPDILFDGGSVTIEGTGLAGATECTFTCQDKAGEKHDTVFGASDFTASADGTRIEISDDMLVGHMRNACSVAMSELATEVDATVKVTRADGTILTYAVTIGE